jgi:tRNA pseudouridine32 synthase/23S rRNA pseudouridine746 synthase
MITCVSMSPPLPVKNGVGPTRLRIPLSGPWTTIAEYVVAKFDHLDAENLYRRFDDSGRYLRESALVRLRVRLDNPDLTPIHRLDRGTAGVVMFSARPATRGAYQSLFEKRQVTKVYEAVSARPSRWDQDAPALDVPLVYRNHIEARRGELRVVVDDSREPNSETMIEARGTGVSASGRAVLHTVLRPHSGRMHQLRVHLAALGAGILGDRRYPDLLPDAPDDHSLPLQLLARELEFTDPLTGRARRFVTRRTLSELPVG